VLDELAGDKSLERFRIEYEKLYRTLKKSHGEGRVNGRNATCESAALTEVPEHQQSNGPLRTTTITTTTTIQPTTTNRQ